MPFVNTIRKQPHKNLLTLVINEKAAHIIFMNTDTFTINRYVILYGHKVVRRRPRTGEAVWQWRGSVSRQKFPLFLD